MARDRLLWHAMHICEDCPNSDIVKEISKNPEKPEKSNKRQMFMPMQGWDSFVFFTRGLEYP